VVPSGHEINSRAVQRQDTTNRAKSVLLKNIETPFRKKEAETRKHRVNG
jgi:hypothetical protein